MTDRQTDKLRLKIIHNNVAFVTDETSVVRRMLLLGSARPEGPFC